MKTRKTDYRCSGSLQEYPGSYVWKEYEYKCPDCRKWSKGSDITQVYDDGTETPLCQDCADKLIQEDVSSQPH